MSLFKTSLLIQNSNTPCLKEWKRGYFGKFEVNHKLLPLINLLNYVIIFSKIY